MINMKIDFIDEFEYAKSKLNAKLNKVREAYLKDKSKLNKIEYLQVIEDKRRLNLLDKEIIDRYANK